ncbi:ATP-dependent RNA helicase RhlB [bacterium]|nr:ATP-dependent RNA helicase RhlB [bacterium]
MLGKWFKRKAEAASAAPRQASSDATPQASQGARQADGKPRANTQSGSRSNKAAKHKPGSAGKQNARSDRAQSDRQQQNSGKAASGDANANANGKPRRRSRRGGRKAREQRAEQAPWSLSEYVVAEKPGFTRFHDLELPLDVMHAIADLGFEYCSPIQADVLPHTLDGYDAIGKAQTGTGKTAAFLITVLHDLLNNPVQGERYAAEPRAIVLAPTRELATQIADDAKALCKYTDLHVVNLIGGMDYDKQRNKVVERFVDIVVATPGRLIDFIQRRDISLKLVDIVVIDEADRMLDMGFIPQVKRIIRETPEKHYRQTLLFSATFTEDIMRLSQQWTKDPVRVEIEPENVTADNVDQRLYTVSDKEKLPLLEKIIQQPDVSSVIVFANRRDQTRRLYEHLKSKQVACGILSGEVSQQQRTRTLNRFKQGEIKVLVATDVAGRGIHVDGISHVVNFNLPEDPEDYVHRIGRTGRAGAKGVSISLVGEGDAFMLMDIETLVGKKLPCEPPPESLA